MSSSFEPRFGLILIDVLLTGPVANGRLRMALDTGATFSMVNNSALVLCGYNICDESEHVEVTTASGIELAPRIKVQSIRALGMQRSDFPILAHTLPARVGIDGLLGLDFLRGHKLEIDFRTGSLSID